MNINNTLRRTLVALVWTFSALLVGCSSNLQDEIKNMNLKELCNKDIKFKKAIESSKIIDKYKYYYDNDDLKEAFEVRFVIKGKKIKGIPKDIAEKVEYAGGIRFVSYKDGKGGSAHKECNAQIMAFIQDKKSMPQGINCGKIISVLATDDMFSLESVGIDSKRMVMFDKREFSN